MRRFSKVCLIVFVIPTIIFWLFLVKQISPEPSQVSGLVEVNEPSEIVITISALGDCALGNEFAQRGHTFADVYAEKGAAYFFANVKEVLAADDLTIANLETCLTNEHQKRDKSVEKTPFWIKGEPGYTQILKEASIEVVNIANNHTFDYGQLGFEETLQSLDKADIAYCGYEHEVIKEIKGIKIGFMGFCQFGNREKQLNKEIKEQIKTLKTKVDLMIVSFHWGSELAVKPSPKQYELAKIAVEAGADLVLGHHPHVLQGIGEYQGKTVVFSLGNFCFGANRLPHDRDTIIYQHRFTFKNGELLKSQNIIIPCSMTTTRGLNDFQPTILSGGEALRVRQKLFERTQMIVWPDE